MFAAGVAAADSLAAPGASIPVSLNKYDGPGIAPPGLSDAGSVARNPCRRSFFGVLSEPLLRISQVTRDPPFLSCSSSPKNRAGLG